MTWFSEGLSAPRAGGEGHLPASKPFWALQLDSVLCAPRCLVSCGYLLSSGGKRKADVSFAVAVPGQNNEGLSLEP